MGDEWEWYNCQDSFFEEGKEFSLEAGYFSVEDAKKKVEDYGPQKALGFTKSPQGYVNIVKVGTTKYEAQGYQAFVRKKTLAPAASAFKDNFAATRTATPSTCAWLRPGRNEGLCDGVQNISLFSGVSPQDLKQGGVGDCWLISSFASMAEFPEALMAVFDQQVLASDGRYVVKLFSFAEGKFVDVEIDDRLPAENGDTVYVGVSMDGEIWPCLLEKAFAKISGGYGELDGGWPIFALGAMSGCTDLRCFTRGSSNAWTLTKPVWKTDKVRDVDWGTEEAPVTDSDFLKLIADFDEQNFVMCAGSTAGSDTDKNAKGIVLGHAYSLIKVAQNVAGTGFNLVQLRNPWGQDEWTGDWGDKSTLWNRYPQVAKELGYEQAEDGTFWMNFDDFCSNYAEVYVCAKNMGKQNRAKLVASQVAAQQNASAVASTSLKRICRATLEKKGTFEALKAKNAELPFWARFFGCTC